LEVEKCTFLDLFFVEKLHFFAFLKLFCFFLISMGF
jgi:hypothetical protein